MRRDPRTKQQITDCYNHYARLLGEQRVKHFRTRAVALQRTEEIACRLAELR